MTAVTATQPRPRWRAVANPYGGTDLTDGHSIVGAFKREKAEFLAHAGNMHDRLVAALRLAHPLCLRAGGTDVVKTLDDILMEATRR